jgi:hypothetical protein
MICWAQEIAMDFRTETKLRQELADAWALVDAGKKDTERLEWLMRNVSGAEFRRLGVRYGGNCGRDRIDAAMAVPNVQIHPTAEAGEARCSRSGGMQC